MNDRTISTTAVLAGICWTIGSLVVIASLITNRNGVAASGLLVAGYGGCLTIKVFLGRHHRQVIEAILSKEKNAFELGRDYGRIHGID